MTQQLRTVPVLAGNPSIVPEQSGSQLTVIPGPGGPTLLLASAGANTYAVQYIHAE